MPIKVSNLIPLRRTYEIDVELEGQEKTIKQTYEYHKGNCEWFFITISQDLSLAEIKAIEKILTHLNKTKR